MKQSLLTRLAALTMLLIYTVSSVGITVHNCDCTGHVCAHIALYLDHIHDGHHECHHHGHVCDEDCLECSHECNHTDCCHSRVYKVSVSSVSDDDCSLHLNAPTGMIAVVFNQESSITPGYHHSGHFIHHTPPPVLSPGGSFRILRV